jgi:hypothetical protein
LAIVQKLKHLFLYIEKQGLAAEQVGLAAVMDGF